MEIVKTKNGERYKEKIRLTNYKTITKTFLNKTDAKKWKQTMEVQKRRDPESLFKRTDIITLNDLFEFWMTNKIKGKRDDKTSYQYSKYYSKHFESQLGEKRIDLITAEDGEKLISRLIASGLKDKSINNIFIFIKQIFKYATEEDLVKSNPFRKIKRLVEAERDFQYLLPEEVLSLLRSNRFNYLYPILAIAVNTGMRLGEIFGLCWDCINLESEQIIVKRTMARTILKERTKTKRIRYIPMNDSVKEIITSLLKNQKNPKFVFAKENGEPYNPDHFSGREFKAALEAAGIKRIRFHDLRHTYASNYMMNGGNLYDLQKILGHTDIETTSIYAHLSPVHLKQAVRVVDFSVEDKPKNIDGPYLALAGS